MGDKKDALPFLRHAHPRRVEQKYLHRIPGIVKSLHDLVDPALGVSQDDPLYILSFSMISASAFSTPALSASRVIISFPSSQTTEI